MPTSNGNYKRWQTGLRHLNSGLSPERTNRLSRTVFVNNTQKKMLKKALPYSCSKQKERGRAWFTKCTQNKKMF